ncbi:MAG: SDR family NAD(P)-dependent oxidoreductase [Anaerolineae bacterium]|nr:SDR family NAD(P)-dependent oxidoreductase [Anaerolineae bacterium]
MPNVAIVTGANQGLGLALVRNLCQTWGDQGIVYLTARDQQRGEAAVRQLQAEGLSPQFHVLDVTDDKSITAFAEFIEQQHGGVDVVISNAAARISPSIPPAQQVAPFIDTNNHGTYRIIKAFMPLLNDGARFLVVASSFGSLQHLPTPLHHKFTDSQLTLEAVEALMDEYAHLVQKGHAVQAGWPEWINIPSKIGQVAAMRVMARLLQDEAEQRDILINAVCPGLVDTAASRPWFTDMSAAQSPDQAAVDVIWLATLPAGTKKPYGELIQHRRVIPFKA